VIEHPQMSGLWHVASQPITKYDLLCKLSQMLGRQDIMIQADVSLACDRSLRGEAFSQETGYVAPPWDKMLQELADEIRQRNAQQETT
jgi:dTDP-4-dehydrorhamnose reductase